MSDANAPVALEQAPNEFIAELLVGILREAGIPAFTVGENLQDEFAASQRLIGAVGCTVYVPRTEVDRARAVLAEARAAGRLEDAPGGDAGKEDADA